MVASRFVLGSLACVVLACSAVTLRAQEGKAANLLRLPSVRVERTSVAENDSKDLPKWTDGDHATSASISASATSPVEVVYDFGDVVSIEHLVVRLGSAAPPPRVEVLASTVAATAGFHQLRAETLRGTTSPQKLGFPVAGARWLLLRLTPPEKGDRVVVAEVECWGHVGPPRSLYAFKEAPARAFAVLAQLKGLSALDLKLTDDEAALFADVKDDRFQTWSLAEAALLADGVQDRGRRKKYLKAIDKLVEGARAATSKQAAPEKKGDLLLRFLHEKALHGGYRANQTTLSGILDTGTFNCVSSAALYNVVASRLGLDARAIEVPDHAFSVVYAGTRAMDVETTTRHGFNPARDRAAVSEFEKTTGFRYIPDRDRTHRREVRDAGLVAIVCYNRGVEATKAKRYHEALMHYFRAMSLDREFASAVKNALAVLANWGVELAREKKFEQGLAVLATGLQLAPKDATLLHNRSAFYGQWADSLAADGRTDEALALLRKAAAEVPAEAKSFRSQMSWVFLRQGEALVKAGKWQEAARAVAPGLTKLDGEPRDEIVRWQREVAPRWAASLRKEGKYAEAVRVLGDALKGEPTSEDYAKSLCYTVHVWAKHVHEREGEEQALAILRKQRAAFPKVPGMSDVALAHVYRLIDGCLKDGKPERGLPIIDRHREVIDKAEQVRDLTRYLVDRWAGQLGKKGDALAALDVYDAALKRQPKDDHLSNNRIYRMQQWVKTTHEESGEKQARAVLDQLRKRYPEESALDAVARAQARRAVDARVEEGKYESAIDVAVSYAAHLGRDEKARQEGVRELARRVYDRWSRGFREKKEWEKAVEVYTRALERFPEDSHLKNNAVATWESWAATHRKKKEWDEAIAVYEKGLKQFPKDFTLKNNLEYCKAMKKKGSA